MKLIITFGLLFLINSGNGFHIHPPIIFQKEPKGAFSFTENWAYAWNIIKHDNGKFENVEAPGIVTPTDTAHLYYTANCKTNVQGGYSIHYCYASRKKGKINIIFADGGAAYSSEFDISIVGNTYSVKPKIIYPALEPGKLVYSVTYTKVILFQKELIASKSISGYIDMRFSESNPTVKSSTKHELYIKGYFKTIFKIN